MASRTNQPPKSTSSPGSAPAVEAAIRALGTVATDAVRASTINAQAVDRVEKQLSELQQSSVTHSENFEKLSQKVDSLVHELQQARQPSTQNTATVQPVGPTQADVSLWWQSKSKLVAAFATALTALAIAGGGSAYMVGRNSSQPTADEMSKHVAKQVAEEITKALKARR